MSAESVDLLSLAHRRPLTVDDLPQDDTGRTELIDGTLYVTPLGDVEHQELVTRLASRLIPYAPAQARTLAGVNVYVSSDTFVIPDVAVVSLDHTVRNGLGVPPAGLLLAVEITSPSTRRTDLTAKRDIYATHGVPWVIVDRGRSAHRYLHSDLPSWVVAALPEVSDPT